jgi:hypothetical protein
MVIVTDWRHVELVDEHVGRSLEKSRIGLAVAEPV